MEQHQAIADCFAEGNYNVTEKHKQVRIKNFIYFNLFFTRNLVN